MTRDEFVKAVTNNAMTVTGYKIGCDGRGKDHLCDCIGLIKGAFAILGVKWGGGPGTNYTARNYVKGLSKFASPLDLKKGDVVLKAREPGQDGYSLPDAYKNDPDQKDYYHIGVVVSTNPFQITHCTSVPGGIQYDYGKKNWAYKGILNPITEKGGEKTMKKAIVFAQNKKPVNLRAEKSITAPVLLQVKVGEEVTIIEEGPEWDAVKYQEVSGYMKNEFLSIVAEVDDDPGIPSADSDGFVTIKFPETLALQLLEVLEGTLGKG